jgi:23S rRNA (cytidine2498-2'-O)-methyltransferase
MTEPADFLLTTCQVGAERALKAEFARRWPELRPAYARPGFVTFKAPQGALQLDEYANSIFARASAMSLGKVTGPLGDAAAAPDGHASGVSHEGTMAARVWQLFGDRPATGLHVWHRDAHAPGDHGYEPGLVEEDAAIARAIRDARPGATLETWVHPGQFVLDCVVVEPHEWWIGYHQAGPPHTCWPGGFCGVKLPPHAVSRAYVKMDEALRWSQLPLQAGQHCVEIGSAPGGAAQALLERGLSVIGIDPAEMHPDVLAQPNFTHIRKRGADVRRREFRKARWLFSDANVDPTTMLDTIEGIVTHGEVNIRGLLLTLKLLDWKMAEQVPEYLFRIRTWGYKDLHARQLQHNRQEICVAALRAQ